MYTKYPDDEIQVFLYVHKGQTHDVSWNMDTLRSQRSQPTGGT